MIPILATTLITYLLFVNGLFFHFEVVKESPVNASWLGGFYLFSPSFFNAIKFSFFDVFVNYSSYTSYNSSLWTIKTEFVGSILIFIFSYIFSYIQLEFITMISPKI